MNKRQLLLVINQQYMENSKLFFKKIQGQDCDILNYRDRIETLVKL